MRKLFALLALLPLALAAQACVVDDGYTVREAPPPAPSVYVEERPGYVFIDGSYYWDHGRWAYRNGYYEAERPGYVYAQGSWERGPSGAYVYRKGAWNARPSGGNVYQNGQRVEGRGEGRPEGRGEVRGEGRNYNSGGNVYQNGQRGEARPQQPARVEGRPTGGQVYRNASPAHAAPATKAPVRHEEHEDHK